ncbi:hypothetical protein QW180_01985 [Vibrio sinaloensis]|nr:hypothetical protein [Vibrio sinaloensis]
MNAVHAAVELDTDVAQQVVSHISHVDHVVKVTLNSSVYDLTLAEVVTTIDTLATERFVFPLYDSLNNQVGSLIVDKKNTDAIGKREIASILPVALLVIVSFLVLAFLFSRQILALVSKPFFMTLKGMVI